MNISLTSELEKRVKAKVESGLYNNASEVIREALRFMETHDEWIKEMKLAKLRSQLAEGISDIEQGNATVVTSKESLKALFDSLKEKD